MNNHKKKMLAPIMVTVVAVIYYFAYFGFVMSLMDGIPRILFGIVPLLLAVGMIYVCIQRIGEIKGGEEDDLSKY